MPTVVNEYYSLAEYYSSYAYSCRLNSVEKLVYLQWSVSGSWIQLRTRKTRYSYFFIYLLFVLISLKNKYLIVEVDIYFDE